MGKDKKAVEGNSGKVSKKTMIIGIIVLIVIFIVSFIGFSFIMQNNKNDSNSSKVVKSTELVTLPLGDEFVVNLADKGSKRYVKTNIVVAYDKGNKQFSKKAEEKTIVLRDAIINYLKLRTVEETKNTDKIKKGLVKSLNKALGEEIIKDVYFQSLIVQ